MTNKEKARWLSDFYREMANNNNGCKYSCEIALGNSPGSSPNIDSDVACWVVNPPKNKTMNMDINEIKNEKKILENNITELSKKFVSDTGCNIVAIEVHQIEIMSGETCITKISIDTRI